MSKSLMRLAVLIMSETQSPEHVCRITAHGVHALPFPIVLCRLSDIPFSGVTHTRQGN